MIVGLYVLGCRCNYVMPAETQALPWLIVLFLKYPLQEETKMRKSGSFLIFLSLALSACASNSSIGDKAANVAVDHSTSSTAKQTVETFTVQNANATAIANMSVGESQTR